jgi:hypothetical protein
MPDQTGNSPSKFEELLSSVGLTSDFVQKVRFRGPVGKLALLGIFTVAGLASVGVRTSSANIAGLCAGLATVVALAIGGAILWFSHKYPDQATLEGMEVVVMHQQKAWAAKGIDLSGNVPVLPNPGGSPPQLNPSLEPDK